MDSFFWTAFAFMACLVLARLIVPRVAEGTLLDRWLRKYISFDDGTMTLPEPELETEPRQS